MYWRLLLFDHRPLPSPIIQKSHLHHHSSIAAKPDSFRNKRTIRHRFLRHLCYCYFMAPVVLPQSTTNSCKFAPVKQLYTLSPTIYRICFAFFVANYANYKAKPFLPWLFRFKVRHISVLLAILIENLNLFELKYARRVQLSGMKSR